MYRFHFIQNAFNENFWRRFFLPTITLIAAPLFLVQAQNQLGIQIDGLDSGDQCGFNVSISNEGNRIAISSPLGETSNAGHVRIFEWDGEEWIQLGDNILGEANGDNSGADVSISANGSRVAIGAYRNNGNGTNSGHVRVYHWVDTNWVQLGSDIDGENSGDWSGQALALSANGQRLAIGAQLNDGNGSKSGHVRVFEWNDSIWIKVGGDLDGDFAGDQSGTDVALTYTGDRVAIGAWSHDGNGNDAGQVRVFGWTGTSWELVGGEIEGEQVDDGLNVVALSADGSILAVGAGGNDDGGMNAGHAKVYRFQGSTWTQMGNTIEGDTTNDLLSRVSLSNNGKRLAISMRENDDGGENAGKVRVYDWLDNNWTQVGVDINGQEFDKLGFNIQLSGDGNRLVVGAPGVGVPGYNGYTHVYGLCALDLTLTNLLIDSDTTLNAGGTINLIGGIVNPSKTLTLKSNEMKFENGFEVKLGARLETILENGCHD